MAKFNFAQFEKSGKDVEKKGKGKEGSKKEEAVDKTQKFAAGGLATTQSNLKKYGRGVARVMNQKSGGAMKKGGMCK